MEASYNYDFAKFYQDERLWLGHPFLLPSIAVGEGLQWVFSPLDNESNPLLQILVRGVSAIGLVIIGILVSILIPFGLIINSIHYALFPPAEPLQASGFQPYNMPANNVPYYTPQPAYRQQQQQGGYGFGAIQQPPPQPIYQFTPLPLPQTFPQQTSASTGSVLAAVPVLPFGPVGGLPPPIPQQQPTFPPIQTQSGQGTIFPVPQPLFNPFPQPQQPPSTNTKQEHSEEKTRRGQKGKRKESLGNAKGPTGPDQGDIVKASNTLNRAEALLNQAKHTHVDGINRGYVDIIKINEAKELLADPDLIAFLGFVTPSKEETTVTYAQSLAQKCLRLLNWADSLERDHDFLSTAVTEQGIILVANDGNCAIAAFLKGKSLLSGNYNAFEIQEIRQAIVDKMRTLCKEQNQAFYTYLRQSLYDHYGAHFERLDAEVTSTEETVRVLQSLPPEDGVSQISEEMVKNANLTSSAARVKRNQFDQNVMIPLRLFMDDPTKWLDETFFNELLEPYFKNMSRPGAFCGPAEIYALSKMEDVCVRIYKEISKGVMDWDHYQEINEQGTKGVVELIHSERTKHYNAVDPTVRQEQNQQKQ